MDMEKDRILIGLEKVLVILRDGRKLIGVFRSYDQFGKSSPLSSRYLSKGRKVT